MAGLEPATLRLEVSRASIAPHEHTCLYILRGNLGYSCGRETGFYFGDFCFKGCVFCL